MSVDKQFSQLQDTDDYNKIFGDRSKRILVLGIGNYLMGDEGIGVQIAHRMGEMDLPEYIDVLDGGTGGFFLMGVFDVYPVVIVIDATMDGKTPGTIEHIKPKFASDFPSALSVHDVGLKDMIEALYLQDRLPDIHLITISISEFMPMTVELSDPILQTIPGAIEIALSLSETIHKELNNA